MRVYLDNCCYNRPYDDQSQLRISLESQAKVEVQNMIRQGKLELATSYMTFFENSENPYEIRQRNISDFQNEYGVIYISSEVDEKVVEMAVEIEKTGVKHKDACHIACAILAECDCFISTDDRLLKYKTDEIKLVNPIEFINLMEE